MMISVRRLSSLMAAGLALFIALFCLMQGVGADDGSNKSSTDVKLTKEDLIEALRAGQKYVEDLDRLEADMLKNDRNLVMEGTPAHTYAKFKPKSLKAVAQSREATVQLVARQHLSRKLGISSDAKINFEEVLPLMKNEERRISLSNEFQEVLPFQKEIPKDEEQTKKSIEIRPLSEEEKKKFEGTEKKEFQEVLPSEENSSNKGESFKKQSFGEASIASFEPNEFGDMPSPRPPRQLCNWADPNVLYFRTADGTCNNLFTNPRYGQSGTIFQRLFPSPSYQDGIGIPRDGPSPRAISLAVVANESLPNYRVTLMTMQWGQFLDHDLTLTPTATFSSYFAAGSNDINCCTGSQTGNLISPRPHPECLPITIPSNDPVFNPRNCMNFVRSAFGLNLDGSTPPYRQQINENTHWLDGSHIYGSSARIAEALRDRSSGLGQLKISISPSGRPLLPTTTCRSCFEAGDERVNEQPLLTIMHTIFVREHNRVAKKLASLVPRKSDDFYYQHARRFVVAKWQHITYHEYLPILIGPTFARQVNSPRFGNPGNPAIFNEFSTAALRMGHSQLKSFIRLLNNNGALTNRSYFMSDSFQNADRLLQPDFMDSALRGLVDTPVQHVDNCFPDDITHELFKTPGPGNHGFDLVALNIQRGRDHGLPPYAFIWQYTNPTTRFLPTSFSQLSSTTTPDIIDYLSRVYRSVLDVDLFIGGVTETPVTGGLVGPTFATLIAHQFRNLKQADRFFYDDLSQYGAFTQNQLADIRRTSLARIICDNSDGSITRIQPQAFLSPSEGWNRPVPCSRIPATNF